MLRQVRAAAPLLFKLAYRSKQASEYTHNCATAFQKKAFVIELDGVNSQLVAESIKLGQSVMSAIAKNKSVEELENFSEDTKDDKPERENYEGGKTKLSMSMGKALLTGAGVAAVPALAANYTLHKASDDFDSKMWAIPGIAAATVGAILAARAGNSTDTIKDLETPAQELENAINAREVLDTAMSKDNGSDVYEELAKMSSISTDHIASLITDLLT